MDQGEQQLAQAIYDTIRYFSLFRKPITVTEIWRCLIVDKEGNGVRWHGQHFPSYKKIKHILDQSNWLATKISTKWGYYLLTNALTKNLNAEQYIRQYLQRYALSQQKLELARRIIQWLAPLPLVKMIGVTGSLSMYNAKPISDIDLFIITSKKRIWLSRLLVSLITELMRKRRHYWHQSAPDKACLNHFISYPNLVMATDLRNIYTAISYHQLILIYGKPTYKKWIKDNETWIKRWIMFPPSLVINNRLTIKPGNMSIAIKKFNESFLTEIVGDYLEKLAERIQRYYIRRHTLPEQQGRISLGTGELSFHPDTKVPVLINRFRQEEGQKTLI